MTGGWPNWPSARRPGMSRRRRGTWQAAASVGERAAHRLPPVVPGIRYRDWNLIDPAGRPIEVVRQVPGEIRGHVEELVAQLPPATPCLCRINRIRSVHVVAGG